MNNEFGYLDLVPFKEINEEEQKLVIVNKKEDRLELKVKDIDKFSTFGFYNSEFGKLIETKIFYGINSTYHPLTLYRCSINSSSFSAIPHSIISSQMYIVGNKALSPITHFTDKTKIKKIVYYNDNIKYIFPSASMTIKRKENEMNIEAKKQKEKIISRTFYEDNKIIIKLINSYSHSGSIYNLNIKPTAYLEIAFQKSVDLDTVLKISNRIDSVIHLFLLTSGRSKELTIYDTKKNSYEFHNIKNNDKEEKQPNFYLDKRENNITNFDKLFNLFLNITNENSNSFFPFLNFDRKVTSTEIQFLEYYRVLEYTDTEMRKKLNKGKNTNFLIGLLKKYPKIKDTYFENQQNNIIEEEIRSLRNYYSHNGYYIEELPIPTFNPIRYKKIDIQWLYDVKNFIKAVAYLEVYSLAGINVDENYLITHLK